MIYKVIFSLMFFSMAIAATPADAANEEEMGFLSKCGRKERLPKKEQEECAMFKKDNDELWKIIRRLDEKAKTEIKPRFSLEQDSENEIRK